MGERKTLAVRLDPGLIRKIKAMAALRGVTIEQMVGNILSRHIERAAKSESKAGVRSA